MGLIHFQPSRRASGPFEIQQMNPTAAVSLTLGEPVQRNASDPEQIEAAAGGATVTGILGVAMTAVTSGTPAFGDLIPVAIANLETEFLGMIWDVSAGVVATPAVATHEGVSFGMVEISNNWYIDEEDVTHVVLRVTKVFPDIKAALFKFISTAIGV